MIRGRACSSHDDAPGKPGGKVTCHQNANVDQSGPYLVLSDPANPWSPMSKDALGR